ncbi:PilX N-terminal domain-containing pilus assembly protein [Amphritea sp. 1_MG-2023]|uniref:pilus assembly PilX family protein n=1 Tax=Amphritea sp. 1_MG-2023 TaxID=3062670 RepID=UPI0026E1A7DD|nr:PilX N-terminal domain-containing pilus assembly protein [Amphritea sp. 1_MG-2023]MDO6563636.1 PilX N-terminal domain-containing pilus assembly protein [Amphritea sp. 1_MG-2023]
MMKIMVCYAVRQGGATLIVALILLLVMTLMASTSLKSNVLQSRMAANMQDQAIAFEAAEAGLTYSEEWLAAQVSTPELVQYDDLKAGLSDFVVDSRSSSELKHKLLDLTTLSQWDAGAQPVTAFNAQALSTVYEQPQVSLELTDFTPDDKTQGYDYGETTGVSLFRHLSRSTGKSGDSEVILQSEYRKRFR